MPARLGDIAITPMTSTRLVTQINKSQVVRSDAPIRRVSLANPDVAEAVAVSSNELVINGKAAGETTLIVWSEDGQRKTFDVVVTPPALKLDEVKRQFSREFAGQDVAVTSEEGSVFLRGTVNDVRAADRAVAIASTLGKVVNLLRVNVPASEPQILLKVKFASIDRVASLQYGFNFLSTGNGNKTPGEISTGQFTPPSPTSVSQSATFNFSDALNILLYRPDLNIGATIQALESKNLIQILAEPNLLTVSGSAANFLAGGEFPFPTIQGGAGGVGQITIQFKEFGVRLRFLPVLTPQGTIRLTVTPEVSALDYANGLTVDGFTVPGLDVRRVQTEVELQNGQSFAIAGLLDNRLTETINKIPGLASIPLLGKLFQSRSTSKTNTELLVLVTPELVRPVPAGGATPGLVMPKEFLKGIPNQLPENPPVGSSALLSPPGTLPVEQLTAPPVKVESPADDKSAGSFAPGQDAPSHP
jgi:pilus assembly protein CpaC